MIKLNSEKFVLMNKESGKFYSLEFNGTNNYYASTDMALKFPTIDEARLFQTSKVLNNETEIKKIITYIEDL